MEPKYPEVTVKLVGQKGNVYNLIGLCRRAMLKAGLPPDKWHEFRQEACSKNYDHAIGTMMAWFTVD
jgi:hypothetical protein